MLFFVCYNCNLYDKIEIYEKKGDVMRKILFLCFMLLFMIACEDEVKAPSKEVLLKTSFKTLPEESAEKNNDIEVYYIHEDTMPNYALLEDYPNEAMIDWDLDSYVDYGHKESFVFTFNDKVCIRAIELHVTNIDSIEITFQDGVQRHFTTKDGYQILNLDHAQMAKDIEITLQTRKEGLGQIGEFHVINDVAVDQVTYDAFISKESFINDIKYNTIWSQEIPENIASVEGIIERYSADAIKAVCEFADLNYIKHAGNSIQGQPLLISGKVQEVINRDGYYEIIVDTYIYHEEVIVIAQKPIDKHSTVSMAGIIIENESKLTIFGIE